MNIDDVARRMTHGTPGAAFTARVMAPIHGRPRPGFTARVMSKLAEPVVAQAFRPAFSPAFSPAFRRALILVPAAIALAAGAIVLMRGSVRMPAIPAAPALATNASGPLMPDTPRLVAAPDARVAQSARIPVPAPTATEPEPTPIYMIAALESPGDIAMKSIDPAACTIPALDAPAPLKVPDLPGNAGGSQKEIKEKL